MMSLLAWIATIGVIAFAVLAVAVLLLNYLAAQYVARSKRRAELEREELRRIERRLSTERHFRMDFKNNILFFDTQRDQIRYTRDFEEWALANLRHPLDIEEYAGLTILFLSDDNEAFAFKMRWG